MRIALVSLIGLCVLAEDGDWAWRLASDDTEARERAVLELEALGDDAIPIARALLGSPDPEVAARAREVLEYLDRTASARRLMAIAGRYSIDAPVDHPRPLGEVLREAAARFEVDVDVPPSLSDRLWSGAFQDLKLLQVLDRVCGDAEVAYAVAPGRVDVFEGKPLQGPRDYPGPFRVLVREIWVTAGNDFERVTSTLAFKLEAVHESCLLDRPSAAVHVDRVEYDTGDSADLAALRKAKQDAHSSPWEVGRFSVMDPPASATALRSIRGRIVIQAPTGYDVWTFDEVAEGAVVKSVDSTATLLSLERYERDETTCLALFVRITGERLGDGRLPVLEEAGSVSLLSAEGTRAIAVRGWPVHHSWNAYWQTVECEARFAYPAVTPPSKLVVKLPIGYETIELPFEIRDVRFRP